uniref:Soluble scavenger receptor cysteine-rich domain-containing protein SSC5D n=1 Tax=Coturnix japonica TaxID=93934 RepID=A0A8C2SZL7_COTJA
QRHFLTPSFYVSLSLLPPEGVTTETPAELRLVNGPSHCAGRVEVMHDHQWGTVCDDDWDLNEAMVVCRQLDCGTAVSAPGSAHFGQGSGRVWLDNVNCTGAEAALSECQRRPWGSNDCTHREDAGVVCSGEVGHPEDHVKNHFPPLLSAAGTNPLQLRVQDGPGSCAGRVEVLYNATWYGICDSSWTMLEAKVVCKQLGCGPAESAPIGAQFSQGHDLKLLEGLNCRGTESLFLECQERNMGPGPCRGGMAAGVVCAVSSQSVELRLVSDFGRCAGRVEVLYNGIWGTVCGDNWDALDGQVVCRQLSCGTVLSVSGAARHGEGAGPIWLDDVNCTGTEAALSECRASPWGQHNCGHMEDASVECSESHVSKMGRIQLLDGPSRCAGRVEVLHDQRWGTICDDGWDLADANVVCRQLGCGTAVLATKAAHYGRGQDTIWLDEVNCTGREESIFDCKASAWGVNNCYHGEDAGVLCSGNYHSDLKAK